MEKYFFCFEVVFPPVDTVQKIKMSIKPGGPHIYSQGCSKHQPPVYPGEGLRIGFQHHCRTETYKDKSSDTHCLCLDSNDIKKCSKQIHILS